MEEIQASLFFRLKIKGLDGGALLLTERRLTMKKPYVSAELRERILKLHHEEFLEAGEIAQILSIPEFVVAYVISPHW